ncbi:L,D-transpeptidase family protein [Cereibacter sphaeroides]|uniref:L,D-transpeptidase family protein n=1 Tax=Cereibacter sphaeroides TaxID=1063 RepID=UPI003AEFED75
MHRPSPFEVSMSALSCRKTTLRLALCLSMSVLAGTLAIPSSARAQVTAFTRSVAEAAGGNDVISAYYRERGYRTLWTGPEDGERRAALFSAINDAAAHGLPVQRYDAAALMARFRAARTESDRGRLEVAMTRALIAWAHDLHSGALKPSAVDPGIKRDVALLDPRSVLTAFEADPVRFLNSLAPRDPEYARLMRAKLMLEAQIARGGWGAQVPAAALKPGASGAAFLALRDRLAAMGYLGRSTTPVYDETVKAALRAFQLDHGLAPDGVAGESTIVALNVEPEERLRSVLVAMERERWLNIDRGERHIWVNLTEFTARVVEAGKVTFETRSVIGKNAADQRSPEFSDQMEYMVINPSWNVPRSITTKEYLPLLQRNPNAAGHLKLIDSRGRVVNRGSVNFNAYNARNFPFSMRQPPSDGNALGLVKFMFPNPWNIYLHDTPSKSLFDREVRAFSHGCIRLGQPFDFAHALLAKQSDDPEGLVQSHLKTGKESVIRLEKPVPVHLVYFTAWAGPTGRMNYRPDIYGRDALIFDALTEAGVVPGAVQG